MDKWTKDFCSVCKNEMRKWITDGKCISMCITDGCQEQGIVKRAIQNHDSFKIEMSITK